MQDHPSSPHLSSRPVLRHARGERRPTTGRINGGMKLGAVLGSVVGWYAGVTMVLPGALTLLTGIVAYNLFGSTRRPLVPLLGIQLGQIACMLVGLVALGPYAQQRFGFVDVTWCGAGLVWLVARPGPAPLYWLAIYQLTSLGANVHMFLKMPSNGVMSACLITNMFWRTAALIAMFELCRSMRWARVMFAEFEVPPTAWRDLTPSTRQATKAQATSARGSIRCRRPR